MSQCTVVTLAVKTCPTGWSTVIYALTCAQEDPQNFQHTKQKRSKILILGKNESLSENTGPEKLEGQALFYPHYCSLTLKENLFFKGDLANTGSIK